MKIEGLKRQLTNATIYYTEYPKLQAGGAKKDWQISCNNIYVCSIFGILDSTLDQKNWGIYLESILFQIYQELAKSEKNEFPSSF